MTIADSSYLIKLIQYAQQKRSTPIFVKESYVIDLHVLLSLLNLLSLFGLLNALTTMFMYPYVKN